MTQNISKEPNSKKSFLKERNLLKHK